MLKYLRINPGHLLGQQWFDEASLSPYADAYVHYLTGQGYARETVECYFRSVAHFLHWISQRNISLCHITESTVKDFLDRHLPHCQCAPQCCHTKSNVRAGLKHFFAMRDSALLQEPIPDVSPAIATELAGFKGHLVEVRGLADTTCAVRLRHTLQFLVDRFGERPIRITRLTVQDVERFVIDRTRGLAPGTIKAVGISLRSYLLFKASQGTPTAALIAALPRVAQWRLSGLPTVLSTVEIGPVAHHEGPAHIRKVLTIVSILANLATCATLSNTSMPG